MIINASVILQGAVVRITGSGAGCGRDWLALTKPKVISLLLFTSIAAMCMAARGLPEWLTLLRKTDPAADVARADALGLYKFSMLYLALVFLALVLDRSLILPA